MIERNFFETIVAGENPASIMQPYNKNILLQTTIVGLLFLDIKVKRIYNKIVLTLIQYINGGKNE